MRRSAGRLRPSSLPRLLLVAWQDAVFELYLSEGKIEPEVVENMRTWPHSGFSVDQSVFLPAGECGIKLARWPLPRLPNWVERVNRPIDEKEEDQLRQAILRSQPYGDIGWVESTARKYGLESTLRKKGRPRKFPQTSK